MMFDPLRFLDLAKTSANREMGTQPRGNPTNSISRAYDSVHPPTSENILGWRPHKAFSSLEGEFQKC
ncbi:MAG: hypothetical protein ACTSXX_10065 [Candidatus Baldrarchaeia archaeon]